MLEDHPGVPIEKEPPCKLNHTDWISKAGAGGGFYRIWLPNPAMDAELNGKGRKATFVAYRRTAFRRGGFPGYELHSALEFEHWRKKRHVQAEYEGLPIRFDLLKQLADGLLAI
jgi:hypothetical protein